MNQIESGKRKVIEVPTAVKNDAHEIQFFCVAIAIFPILSIQGELRPVALI